MAMDYLVISSRFEQPSIPDAGRANQTLSRQRSLEIVDNE
jgi:hypothetical protein